MPLDEIEQQISARAYATAGEALSFLERAVNIPSATENHDGVRATGELFGAKLRDLGFETRWIDMPPEMDRAGHLFAERAGAGPRALLIGHLDTVLEGESFRTEGDWARGTGVSDMKGGNTVILYALEALHHTGALAGRNVVVALTGDEEEAGRPLEISRAALIDAAHRSDFALAFECSIPGTGTIARRGIVAWRIDIEATTGHSSRIFTDQIGGGAIYEAARIIEEMRRIVMEEDSLTINPSLIVGGTTTEFDHEHKHGRAEGKTNVVPASVTLEGDLRFLTNEQRDRVIARIREIVSRNLPRTACRLQLQEGYPAMAPVEANMELLRRLDEVSRDLGHGAITALDPLRRGAGDVSFVAPLLPSLDGLGALGDNEHAVGEFIDFTEMPRLVARAAILLHRLWRG